MKKRNRLIALIIFTTAFMVLGAVGHQATAKMILRYGTGIMPVALYPHNYVTAADLVQCNLIFDNLLTFDHDQNPVPALATSWEMINDTTWRLKLRKGVKFTDGTPFNAEAAKINLEIAKEQPKGKRYYNMIESVTIEDPYTILIKTYEPHAPFLNKLCIAVGGMVSPKAIEKYGDKLAVNPVGSGPFKLKEWVPKVKMVLERNDDYWGKKPKLDEFHVFQIPEEGARAMAFESGNIDVNQLPAVHRIAEYRKNPKIKIVTTPGFRIFYLGFNTKDKLLRNKNLRKAIAHAINVDEIVDYVMEGVAVKADTVLAQALMKSKEKSCFDYDPAKSKELLAEAGYPNGVEVNLWTPEGRYLKDRQIAEAIQGQLAKVGIKAKLSVKEFASWIAATGRHEHQMSVFGFGFSTAEPNASMKLMFYSGATYNTFNYADPKMDNLLDKAAATMDPEKRRQVYEEAERLIIDEVLQVPIYHEIVVFATSDKVKNFRGYPTSMIDISETTIE